MKRRNNKTADAIEIIHQKYYRNKPARLTSLEKERLNAAIARQIYDLRIRRGLTQRELAGMVGTTTSVISRLEDSDYGGRSLSMLQRIAAALKSRVQVKLVADKGRGDRTVAG